MRKTSRIWRAPARGLPKVWTAKLLAVVLAGETVVVLAGETAVELAGVTAVVSAVFMAVVLAVFMAVVLAVFTAVVVIVVVVVIMVLLVSKLSGGGVKIEDFPWSTFREDSEAVRLTTMKTRRLTLVTSSESGTVQFVWKTSGLLGDVKS